MSVDYGLRVRLCSHCWRTKLVVPSLLQVRGLTWKQDCSRQHDSS